MSSIWPSCHGESQNLKVGGGWLFAQKIKTPDQSHASHRWELGLFCSFSEWISCWKLVTVCENLYTHIHTKKKQAIESCRAYMIVHTLYYIFYSFVCVKFSIQLYILKRDKELEGIFIVKGCIIKKITRPNMVWNSSFLFRLSYFLLSFSIMWLYLHREIMAETSLLNWSEFLNILFRGKWWCFLTFLQKLMQACTQNFKPLFGKHMWTQC